MKRFGAWLLSIVFCLSILPMAILAQEDPTDATGDPSSSESTETGSSATDTTEPTTQKRITIQISETDFGYLEVMVEDEDGNVPTGITLYLTVDGREVETQQVGDSKRVTFDYALQAADTEIVVSSEAELGYRAASEQYTRDVSPEDQLGFTFRESSRRFDGDTGEFTMNWNYNYANGWDITALIVDGERHPVEAGMGRVRANILNLPHGSHTLAYVFSSTNSEKDDVTLPVEPLVRTGTVETTVQLSVEGRTILVTVTDAWDRPVPQVPVILTVGGTSYAAQETGEDGTIAFNASVSAGMTIRAETETITTEDGVTYQGASASLEISGESTTSTGTDTTTSSTTRASALTTRRTTSKSTTSKEGETTTTARTYPTVTGAGTTAYEENMVVVNTTFDTGVVDAFGLSQQDFEGKARLLIDQEDYAEMVSDSDTVIMLSARYSPIEVTDDHISTAIANQSRFSRYHAENVRRVTFDLGLIFRTGDTEMLMTSVPDAAYTVQLPIPDDMKDVKLIAVATTDENGIATPVEVRIEDGCIRFDTRFLSTFTLLGFTEATSLSVSKTPTLVIVMFIVAGVLLVGAALLLYFFVLRKPPEDGGDGDGDGNGPQPEPSAPSPTANTMEDIFSGEPPITIVPPSQPFMEDLYSSDDRRPRPGTDGAQGVSLDSLQNRRPPADQNRNDR